MSLARRLLLIGAAGACLLGPGLAAADTEVKGSGTALTQRREIGAFSGVALSAPFTVVLRAGSRESIEIVGDDNIVPLVKTSLRSTGARSTLQIELPRDTRVVARVPVVVTIDYVRVEALAIGGTGNISGNALKSAKLEASIGGSGTLRLPQLEVGELAVSMGGSGVFAADGTARSVAISVAGSGRCDTERLAAADVNVSIAGSGDARVRADASLRVSIAGSGDVYYSGTATPQVSVVGSGRIKKI